MEDLEDLEIPAQFDGPHYGTFWNSSPSIRLKEKNNDVLAIHDD